MFVKKKKILSLLSFLFLLYASFNALLFLEEFSDVTGFIEGGFDSAQGDGIMTVMRIVNPQLVARIEEYKKAQEGVSVLLLASFALMIVVHAPMWKKKISSYLDSLSERSLSNSSIS